MKDLLYLKDDQIKDFIQLLFYAYRETFLDPKDILAKKNFGLAHLRAINLVEKYPGISLSELMFKLKITKQSLNRVMRELIKAKIVKQVKDESDSRKKNKSIEKDGKQLFEKIYELQKKRISFALRSSEPDSVFKIKEVLNKIINGKR